MNKAKYYFELVENGNVSNYSSFEEVARYLIEKKVSTFSYWGSIFYTNDFSNYNNYKVIGKVAKDTTLPIRINKKSL